MLFISNILFKVFFKVFFVTCRCWRNFTFYNNCPYTVWPGIVTGTGPPFPLTGFQLNSKTSGNLSASPSWSGRIWARTHCVMDDSSYHFTCAVGDCGSGHIQCHGACGIPPASLFEFTLASNSGGKDFYDISLVDGFNLPLSVTPGAAPAALAWAVRVI